MGVEACGACHASEYESFRQSPHSKALGDLDPGVEPADTQFVHAASGRTYRVYRADGQMRHRESAIDERGEEYVAADYPIRYLVGSGHHTRSYLVEADGFLLESPLTWYVSRQAWGMSPGYDHAEHRGFERPAESSCLVCHVGRILEPQTAYQKFSIAEQAIGCERCHGPGAAQHGAAARRRDGRQPPDGEPAQIVHPARLSRSATKPSAPSAI